MFKSFISVGIDVGADFSFMSIALPNQTLVGKPFKITHSNLNSLESTGIYHYQLFCHLRDRDFDVNIINPIISNSTTNFNIRKVHILMQYYQAKCQAKPKMVAIGAVMHKVCNIVFAVLHDKKPFEIISPEEHKSHHKQNLSPVA